MLPEAELIVRHLLGSSRVFDLLAFRLRCLNRLSLFCGLGFSLFMRGLDMPIELGLASLAPELFLTGYLSTATTFLPRFFLVFFA